LTNGLSQADDDMVEFNDEDETPIVREPNFFAPGQSFCARTSCMQPVLDESEACRSRVRDFEL
jgi:hypothetical protein